MISTLQNGGNNQLPNTLASLTMPHHGSLRSFPPFPFIHHPIASDLLVCSCTRCTRAIRLLLYESAHSSTEVMRQANHMANLGNFMHPPIFSPSIDFQYWRKRIAYLVSTIKESYEKREDRNLKTQFRILGGIL